MISKICKKCGIDKLFTEYSVQVKGLYGYTARCKQCHREQGSLTYSYYYNKRKETRINKGLCLQCKEPRVSKFYCQICLDKKAAYKKKNWIANRDHYLHLAKNRSAIKRQLILDAYGNKCVCCGESEPEFLQLDHINNDGNKQRKDLGIRYIYQWIIDRNFPKDNYQLLCANCNWSKRKFGDCIHVIRKNYARSS